MADKKTNRLEEVLRLREENKSKYSSGYRTGRDIARERLTKIIGMDTFETDLENMGNTIHDIQSNWQTPETMANTKAAVEAMHGRIGGYQTYQKLFGGKDLTDLQNRYQSILEGWDDIAQSYTKFDSNESYQKALADARAYQERYEQMRTSDLDAAKKELDALQAHSDKVDEYENTLQGLNNRKSTYNSRTRGLAGDGNFDEEIKSKQIEYSEYLKSTGYSNTEDLRKALNEKTLFYNQAKHIQNKESLEEIRKDENFQSYVESGLALADEKEGLFNSESKNKIAYNRLHPEQLELAEQLAKGESKFSFGSEEYILESDLDYKAAKYMTNEQFETYNAYLGREGEEKAEEYLKAIEEDLNVAMANDIAGNKTNLLDKYTFAAESGVDQFWENTFNLFSKDDYIVPSATQMASGLVREGLDGSGFEVFGSSIGQVAYDAINTTANMAPSILTSMVVSTLATPVAGAAVGSTIGSATGSLAMGASAAGSGYQEMLNLGYNKDQARTYSTLVGASEGMMQYLLGGIGALGGTLTNNVAKSIVSGIDNAFFKFSVNLALNGVGEGIEEGLQDIIAPSFENIIAGYEKNKMEDIDWEQVAYDTMLGALTSWAIEGSSDAVSYIGQHSYNASTGKNLKANDKLSGFADLFDTMEMQGLTPEQSEAYKLYGEYLQKGDIDSLSNAKIGKLYNTAMSESVETMGSKDSTESQVKDAASRYVILDEMSKPKAAEKKVQERVETLNKGEVTEVTSTGNSTTIEGIKIEDGSTIVLTSEGEHKAEDMTFSSNDAELVAYAEVMGAEKGNLLIKNYDGSQNINSYVNSFNMAYTYGEDGIGVDNAIKNKGVLTEKQVSEIYTTAIKQKSEARQKAIDEVVKKYSAKTIKKGVFDDSIIDYNSKNTDGTKVNWNTLTTKQREAIRFAKAFSKVTGVNIVFEKSKIVNGQHKGKNGSYNPNNNTITLDVYAGRMDASTAVDAIIPTLSHEVTHWMKAKAPEMYSKLQEKVMNTLALDDGINMDQRITAEMVRMKKEHPNSNVTPESAIDEIVARSCEDMLSNSETARELLSSLSEKEQKTFMEKVEEVFNNLIEWVNNLLGQYKSESDEAKFLSEYKEQLQEAQKMWDQAFAEAVKTNQALQKKGKTAEAAIRESLEKNGVITNGDNATVYSVRYLLDEKTKDKVASDLVKALGVTKAEADNYLAAETSIASIVLNPKHQEFLDYEADDGEVAIKKNSDYPQGTVDFSNICAKRRDFTSVMNRVMSKFKDHIFLSTDLAKIRTIMSDEKITIPCGICYVEDRRQLDSIVAEDFIKALELYRNGSNTRPDGKPFNANQLKALKMVDNNTYTPSIYELITLEGRNALKDKDPDMESAWINYNNARGMQSVRLLTNEAEYKREILKYSPAEVKRKNDLGGLRIYSFSDAEIPHLIDLVQVITDSASKGLAIQGYTKVNWYANMIKNTGVKINRSLIPLGSLGYRIENGKVVLEYDTVEGIDINDKNFFDNTEYDNVGNILIGINEVQIKAAMLDKFVDYIIPFHTGQSADVLKEKGIHEWQNYKNSQSERKLSDGKKSDKQINIYTDVIQRAETEGNPITNKVEFVEKFLAVCKENGLIPRFSEFLNTDENGDYVYTEGYHKLIIDFKMFNPTTGEYLPQKPVAPNFDNDFITQTLNEFVEQEKTKQIELQPKMDKAIERIEKEVIGMQHSDRNEFGLSLYTEKEIENWRNSNILYANSEQDIIEYVENHVKTGENTRLYCGKISGQLANRIMKDTGYNLDGYNVSITSSFENSHANEDAEALSGQIAMTPSEVAKFPYVISDYDTVTFGGYSKENNPVLKFEKVINGRKIAVTYVLTKRRMLKLQTIYGWAIKKNHLTATNASTSDADVRTSKTNSDTDSSYIISDSDENAIFYEQNSDRDSDYIGSRTLLSNALETVAQTIEEKELLTEYRKDIDILGIKESELSEIKAEIKELSFAKGKRDTQRLEYLQKRAEKLQNSINWYDKKLLNMEAAAPLKAVVDRERAKARKKAYEKNREYTRERMTSYKESVEKKAKIDSITQKALTLNKWLKDNSKNNPIPEPFKPVVVQLLTAIDFSSRQKLGMYGGEDVRGTDTKKDVSIAKALGQVYEMAQNLDKLKLEAEKDGAFLNQLDFPPFFLDELKQLIEYTNHIADTVGDKYVLNQMSLEQLQNLDKIVSALRQAIKTANNSLAFADKVRISDTSEKWVEYLDSIAQKKMENLATEFLEYDNATPYYVFKRFGETGQMMFNALMDAQEKFAMMADEIETFAKETFTPEQAKKWSEEILEFEVLDTKKSTKDNPQYKTLKMTVAHAMSIYALSKREAAKGHLVGGGIRIKDFKTSKLGEKIKDNFGATLSKTELGQILHAVENRNDGAREVADKLQNFMSTTCAEWGNEVTMRRWAIEQFGEEFYFPMETIKNGTNFDKLGSTEESIYSLVNANFTKALTPNADNKLVIDNIFDVFAKHTVEMAKYNSFALPTMDIIKVLGYSRKAKTALKNDGASHDTIAVATSLTNAFGDGGLKYIVNLIKDLNGAEKTPRGEAITKKLMSNYKIQAVGNNLRVALLQGTAYIKASLNMDTKYLLKALATSGKRGSEKALKYSGIALWKSKGHYDLNISRSVASRIKQDQTLADKIKEGSLYLAALGDERTWGRLWNACEYWAEDHTSLQKGTEEFNKAVAKRFRDVIVSTQVVDSTLTRSQMMRSKSAMTQTLTAFMSEGTMTYNMLADAFFEWSVDARQNGNSYKGTIGKHGRRFARTVGVWALTNIVTSAVAAGIDAIRDDDDDEKIDEKLLAAFFENLQDNLNPLGMLPIAKDIKSAFEGYSASRFDEQSFTTLYQAYKKWLKVFEGNGNVYKASYKTLQGVSQLTGLPISNAVRDVVAMWNTTVGSVYPSLRIE